MPETTYFPRYLILGGAMISGVLLALAVHMLGARYGLDLGGLWRSDRHEFRPAGAAIAWWLIASVGFSGGPHLKVLRDDGAECAVGEQGEMCVRGECVTSGYELRDHMKKDPNLEAFHPSGPGGAASLPGQLEEQLAKLRAGTAVAVSSVGAAGMPGTTDGKPSMAVTIDDCGEC